MRAIINEIGDQVFRLFYKITLFIYGFVYLFSIARSSFIDTTGVFLAHTLIFIALILIVFYLDRLSLAFKLYTQSILFFTASFIGLINFGLSGSHYLVLFAIGTIFLFGSIKWLDYTLVSLYVISYLVVVALLIEGVIVPIVDPNILNTSVTHWGAIIMGLSIAGIYFFILMKKYSAKILQLNSDLTVEKENLSQMQDSLLQFVSVFSHDLKNSLGAIHSQLKFINKKVDQMPLDRLQEQLSFLENTSKEQFTLLQNILFWSKYQIGNAAYVKEPVNLIAIIDEVKSLYKLSLSLKNIEIIEEMNGQNMVMGNRFILHMVLRNLIDNAIKFSFDYSVIVISVKPIEDGSLALRVTDQGIGIPENARKKIFDLTETYHTDGTSGEKGTGFGLKLVYTMVQKMGCKMEVESTPGKGTTFTVICPSCTQLTSSGLLEIQDDQFPSHYKQTESLLFE